MDISIAQWIDEMNRYESIDIEAVFTARKRIAEGTYTACSSDIANKMISQHAETMLGGRL